jgi:3'-phosphoadenosine 5'-phosphosulfate sulfotransferase (PAPS reductase)/FAD synthetase
VDREGQPGRELTRRDTWAYLKANDLPHNPLYDLGYASIGCAPCTRMRFEGEHERSGRWAGLSKWECGIHQREADETIDLTAGEVAEVPEGAGAVEPPPA